MNTRHSSRNGLKWGLALALALTVPAWADEAKPFGGYGAGAAAYARPFGYSYGAYPVVYGANAWHGGGVSYWGYGPRLGAAIVPYNPYGTAVVTTRGLQTTYQWIPWSGYDVTFAGGR